jgi:hypothetical protein
MPSTFQNRILTLLVFQKVQTVNFVLWLSNVFGSQKYFLFQLRRIDYEYDCKTLHW